MIELARQTVYDLQDAMPAYISEKDSASHAEKQAATFFIHKHCFTPVEIPYLDNKGAKAVREVIRYDGHFSWPDQSFELLLLWARAPETRLESARTFVTKRCCLSCKGFVKWLNEFFDIDLCG